MVGSMYLANLVVLGLRSDSGGRTYGAVDIARSGPNLGDRALCIPIVTIPRSWGPQGAESADGARRSRLTRAPTLDPQVLSWSRERRVPQEERQLNHNRIARVERSELISLAREVNRRKATR